MDSPAQHAIDHTCGVCCGAIKSGDGRFRVGETEYHPDCFRFWLTTPSAREDETIE